MSDYMSFKVEGLGELMSQMQSYPEKLKKKALEPALVEITEQIKNKARALVPKDTGELEKHIVAVPKTKGLSKHEVARAVIVRKSRKISVKSAFKSFVKVGKNGNLVFTGKLKGKHVRKTTSQKRVRISAYYAHFLEYGTKNMKPRPFMRPASKAVQPKIPEIFAKHIQAVNNEINKNL